MKWKNKGCEFDELGKLFLKNNKILILGEKETTLKIKEELDFLDSTVECGEYGFIKHFLSILFGGMKKTIIIANDNRKILNKLLKIRGVEFNKNVFFASEFLKKYLSVFALYVCDKVYSGIGTCIVITTHCTLNCKYCLNLSPYIKNKSHRDFEELKKDMDIFFSCVDRVKYFSLTGGEPMLHPKYKELIEYVNKNYRHKIWEFGTVANGTMVPSDEVLMTLKNCKVELVCNDYAKSVASSSKEIFEQLVQKCSEFGLNYKAFAITRFGKFFPPKNDYTKHSEEQLNGKFNKCKNYYSGHEIKNGKLYSCCYSGFANTANVVNATESDYYDLNTQNNYPRKRELVEFKLDYNEKGYVEFCKYCNGFPSINNEFDEIEGGGVTQIKKGEFLEWNIESPTYL